MANCARQKDGLNYLTYLTSGQRKDTTKCDHEFAWKPKEESSSPMVMEFTNFIYPEPDCGGGNEHCITVNYGTEYAAEFVNHRWFDDDCDKPFCYVCQIHLGNKLAI